MVVDESENLGVVLIGVNNPHLREEEVDQYRICQALDNHPLLGTIHLKGTLKISLDGIQRGNKPLVVGFRNLQKYRVHIGANLGKINNDKICNFI